MMFTNEVFCLGNHWRLGVIPLDEDLVAQHRQMFGKNGEQLDRRRVLFARDDPGCEVRFLQNAWLEVHSPTRQQIDGLSKLPLSRLPPEHRAGPQKANQPVPQPHRHHGLGQTGVARGRARDYPRVQFTSLFFSRHNSWANLTIQFTSVAQA